MPITPAERDALDRLLESGKGRRVNVRVVGPVRPEVEGDLEILEVREWYRFGSDAEMPRIRFITLGVRVSSPYGLGEPWMEVRNFLTRVPGVVGIAESPNANESTAIMEWAGERPLDLSSLNQGLQSIGIGAHLTGVETFAEGRLIDSGDQLMLETPKLPEHAVAQRLLLAPLSRKVQWDPRGQQEVPSVPKERHAYRDLRTLAGSGSPRVRITGPIVPSPNHEHWLMEVRTFETNPSPQAAAGTAQQALKDHQAPEPIAAVREINRGNVVFLDWTDSDADDLAGYRVYRTEPGAMTKRALHSGLIAASKFEVRSETGRVLESYSVTAIDIAGNESEYSLEIDAASPKRPAGLRAIAGTTSVHLDWYDSDEADLGSYSVHRAEADDGPFVEICVGLTSSEYVDTGIESGKIYHYAVTAVDQSSNASSRSESARATTLTRSPLSLGAAFPR